jgi:conjugal transfer/entry exclusion protein
MDEITLLQQISEKLDKLQGIETQLQAIALKLNSIDFYFGILVGVLLGFIFWNVAKEVS